MRLPGVNPRCKTHNLIVVFVGNAPNQKPFGDNSPFPPNPPINAGFRTVGMKPEKVGANFELTVDVLIRNG